MKTIQTKIGEFTYDEKYEWYVMDNEFAAFMLLPIDKSGTVSEATMAAVDRYGDDLEGVDQSLRKYAAKHMLENANEWLEDDDQELLTEEQFAERISITDITFNADGSIEGYYDDDEIFAGHCIIVSVAPNGHIEDADIAG